MNTQEIVKEIENAVLDIKGRDLVSIDMNGRSDVTDVMMICSGTSVKHTAAIADRVARALKSRKIPIFGIEGEQKGDWVLMSDVDESVPLAEFAVLAPLADRAIVCGSRRCGKDARPFHRRVLSALFNALTGTGLKDTQCGFKLFNMALMRPIFESQRTERFAFDVELIRKAPSVVEVPVPWRGGRRSSLKVWRDAPRMLWDLIRIRCS